MLSRHCLSMTYNWGIKRQVKSSGLIHQPSHHLENPQGLSFGFGVLNLPYFTSISPCGPDSKGAVEQEALMALRRLVCFVLMSMSSQVPASTVSMCVCLSKLGVAESTLSG